MVLGAHIGQAVGLQFGSFLGRQLLLGACREDRDDDLDRRPFTPRLASASLPGAVDLRPWMAPVEDQGSLGSCTANALVGALEYLARRERGWHVDLSRSFVYYNQRLWDECVPDDIGAAVSDGVRVLSRLGVPREVSWPYERDLFAVQPPGAVYREAASLLVSDWWSVPVDGDAFRGCLAAGFPIVFGTRVTESFVQTRGDGMCGMPRGLDDRKHGRHALLAVGYEDRRRLFVVRNSWGPSWGDAGYVYMPYDYVLNPAWTSGCWAIRLSSGDGFDPSAHAVVDLRSVPRAPPGTGGGATVIGGAASIGAQAVVGAFTGSGLLAGLAGGLVAGVVPGVSRVLSNRRGVFSDQDRSDHILSILRGTGAPGPALVPLPWDDGYDEEAAVTAIDRASAERPVRTRPRAGGSATPIAPPVDSRAVVVVERRDPPRIDPALVDAIPEHVAQWWRRDGGAAGPLGAPIAPPVAMHEGAWTGVAVRFADGAMFAWDPPPGRPRSRPLVLLAREPAYAKWIAIGAAHALGWPVGEIEDAADGARLLRCTRGSIVASAHGAYAIGGSIFALWQQLGGTRSDLGHPIADPDEPADPGGVRTLRFERGALCWSPSRGAWRA